MAKNPKNTPAKPKHKANIEALIELKRVVQNIPYGLLDLRTYGKSKTIQDDPADLAAWASRDPWFSSRGFYIEDYATVDGVGRALPKFEDAYAEGATKAFFRLTDAHNKYLFGSYADEPSPFEAVLLERIENVMYNTVPE